MHAYIAPVACSRATADGCLPGLGISAASRAKQQPTCNVLRSPGGRSRHAVVVHAVAMSSCVLALGILQGCAQTSRQSMSCSLLSLPDHLLPLTLRFPLTFALLLSTCEARRKTGEHALLSLNSEGAMAVKERSSRGHCPRQLPGQLDLTTFHAAVNRYFR